MQAKHMFSGWGLSVDGLTVAIIAWDRLYLKANAQTQPHFTAAGCQRFEYEAKGKTRRLHYYTAPECALESRAAMQGWADLAMQAAMAARKPAGRGGVGKAGAAVAKSGKRR